MSADAAAAHLALAKANCFYHPDVKDAVELFVTIRMEDINPTTLEFISSFFPPVTNEEDGRPGISIQRRAALLLGVCLVSSLLGKV